jgi:hypothetical protein
MLKWTRMLVIALALLMLAGCSSNFDAFKELGVSNKNVPNYDLSSEITDTSPPTKIWSTVNAKDIDENQVKQIQADYIQKKLKDNGQTIKGILIIVNVKKDQYSAQYVKDEETWKTVSKAQTPKKLPAIIYSKISE